MKVIDDRRTDLFSEDYYKVYVGSDNEFLFDDFYVADAFCRSLSEEWRLVHIILR